MHGLFMDLWILPPAVSSPAAGLLHALTWHCKCHWYTLRAQHEEADRLWDAKLGQGYNQPNRSAQVNSWQKIGFAWLLQSCNSVCCYAPDELLNCKHFSTLDARPLKACWVADNDASGSGTLHRTTQFDTYTVKPSLSLAGFACSKTFYSKLADDDCQSETI